MTASHVADMTGSTASNTCAKGQQKKSSSGWPTVLSDSPNMHVCRGATEEEFDSNTKHRSLLGASGVLCLFISLPCANADEVHATRLNLGPDL